MSEPEPANPSTTHDAEIGSATRTVAGLTLVSRVLGLARDLVTVRVFGDTAVGSAFAAAFAIPNMFRRLFGEGALSAAFIPEYTRLADSDRDEADAFASLTIAMLALVTGTLTVLIELGLLAVILLSSDAPERVYSLKLVMVMMPFMPLICVAAILGGMLQSHSRFGPWAAAPILLNLCIIAAALPYFLVDGADARVWAYPIGIAAVFSALLQVLWSMHALRGLVRWTRLVSSARQRTHAMLKRMIPVIIGLGTLQLNSFADTLIAMYPNWFGGTLLGHEYPLDDSSNAILFYAQRLYQFPLGVFGIAVATAAFPTLSRHANNPDAFASTLRRGIRLSLYIGIPATIGLWIVRTPMIETLYGHGGFSEVGVQRASIVLAGYSVAIWAYSLNQLFTRSFYATGNTRTPMTIAIGAVLLNLTLNLTLIWRFREAGLAFSTAISAVAQSVVLAFASRRLLAGRPLLDRDLRRGISRILVGCVIMGSATFGVVWVMGKPASWAQNAGTLGAATLVGAAVYGVWSISTRMPELRWLLARTTNAGGTTKEHTDEQHTP
ncbi:MAG: murein biosynthesis integral membrane protein MurJ [Phycisphaerales bacterium]|nr:murein biosynthesis integral membrane protein MurJ [Phycisphaerales bacterium]